MSLQQGGPRGGQDEHGRRSRLGVYDPELVRQIALNLFRGWPYAAYREESRLRGDDQLIRAKAAWLLGLARAAVDVADLAWRRERLPPPTETQPYPDPEAIEAVQSVERLGRTLSALIAQLHALPTPPIAGMVARHRKDAGGLRALSACDEQLIGHAELLRISLEGKTGPWIVGAMASLEPGLAAIEAILRDRRALLAGPRRSRAAPNASAHRPR